MRYQSLLLSGLFMSLISLPIPAQAQTKNSLNYGRPVKLALAQQLNPQIVRAYANISNGIQGKNIYQIFAAAAPEYSWTDASGTTRNLQQTIQTTSKFLQDSNNLKYRRRVESINYNSQFATVSGTVVETGSSQIANNSYSREIKFQDTWQRTNNGWIWINQRDLSQNIAWAKPRQQGNSTRKSKSRHDTMRAFNLAYQAVQKCYEEKELSECSNLDKIKSTVADWCVQGDQEACALTQQIRQMVATKLFYKN